MDEYIKREKVLKIAYYHSFEGKYAADVPMINAIPAADVAPVVHGWWDDSGRYTFPDGKTAVRCSECGCALTEVEYRMFNWNYCPTCGAKMDLDGGVGDA